MFQDKASEFDAEENQTEPGDTSAEMEQFDDFMSNYLESMPGLEVGKIISAIVVEIGREHVLLDVGDKAEGVCSIREFQDYKGEITIQPGQEVDVVVESRDSETGQVNVSHRKARHRAEWGNIVKAYEAGQTVFGVVTRTLKNGVLVDVGIPCFLPASQVDIGRVDDLESLVGQTIECYIIDIDRQRHRGVLSRRRLLAEQKAKKRDEQFATLAEDQVIKGRVKNVVEFGVFVDLGNLDGLVPREEVSWEKRVAIADALKPGEEYEFKITAIDQERGRVTLSRKQLSPDPWLTIRDDYPAEQKVTGTISNLTNNCAYVVLENGVEGRIHRDNLSWLPNVRKPSDLLKKSESVEPIVLGYDDDKRLLELGLKQTTVDPWADIDERFPLKSTHTVTISDVVSFGAFAKIDDYTKGLIHLSDMTWDKTVRDPNTLVKTGDEVKVSVVKIDKKNRRINFGIKQLEGDPFANFIRENPSGSTVTGTVKNISGFGAFVELAPLVEGLLHVSQWSHEKIDSLESVLKPGDEITLKITKIEKKDRKISLSRRAMIQDEERKVVEQYKKQGKVSTATNLGNLLKDLDIKINN